MSSTLVSVAYSKLGPSTIASTGHAAWQYPICKVTHNTKNVSKEWNSTTEDALSHINIITSGSPASIFSYFSFNSNCLCWTHCFTQFACNTSLFSCWISTKSMFTSKSFVFRLDVVILCTSLLTLVIKVLFRKGI
jgi:hypothetical protein